LTITPTIMVSRNQTQVRSDQKQVLYPLRYSAYAQMDLNILSYVLPAKDYIRNNIYTFLLLR
jgi:hypothetical protein